MIGRQGTPPETIGRPVMGYGQVAPDLLRPGDSYPHPIQAPRPPDPPVGVHATYGQADQPWPQPLVSDPSGAVYGGQGGRPDGQAPGAAGGWAFNPTLETSERYPAVHGTEPFGLNRADDWRELGPFFSWRPPQTGVYWGVQLPRAVPPDNDRMKPTARMQFASYHDSNGETRMALGGHVVIRRYTTPTGLPGQTPYYQAPNTWRTGQPPRWDQTILIGQITPNR